MSIALTQPRSPKVPPQALLVSLVSLWVPVLSSSFFPDWTNTDVGILVWLLALIPPFLLSYYRGWRGASAALALGMAAFTLAQVVVTLTGAEIPAPQVMLGIAIVLIGVSLGSGAISTVLRRSLDQAERLALTDPGTGLPNRRHGMLHLQRAFAAAERGSSLSVVLFDLDKFKRVNDRFGHKTGDDVLRVFAEILATHTRTMNLSVRFGGEEFMTILDGIDGEDAARMAERVLAALRTHQFPWGRVTVSAGISGFERGMASPDVLIAAADQALYRAKSRGGDQVVVLARQGADGKGVVRVDEPAPEAVRLEGNGELVLIVDDDPAVLRTLGRALRRRRYHPIEATDPHQALTIARGLTEPIDLVIADLVMPGMSGFRLVEMLMEIQPRLRALYISGYSKEEVSWSGVPGTLKGFLPKPISLDAITLAVRRSLDSPLEPGTAPAAVAPERRRSAVAGDVSDRLAASLAHLEESYAELLARLGWAAEYRDDLTGRHAERVGRLAGLVAGELSLGAEEIGRIEKAATLHDLGKIGMPDTLLNKPGPLTPTEREIMHRHCVIGARLLAGGRHPLLREAERIARSHHERWDGAGYPDGLSGTGIPRSARITAVADTFDSLTQSRPYRSAVPAAEALQVVREGRGTQFDPEVVDAFLRIAERGLLDHPDLPELAGEWHGDEAALVGASLT